MTAALQKIQAYINNTNAFLVPNELANAFRVSTSEFAFQLNKFLRANLATPAMETYLKEVDQLLHSTTLPMDVVVHRACNLQEMLPTIMNKTYLDHGYMSTSLRLDTISSFFNGAGYYLPAYLEIMLPLGTPMLLLNQIEGLVNDTQEVELLLGRRSRFEVIEYNHITDAEKAPNLLREVVIRYGELNHFKLKFQCYLPG